MGLEQQCETCKHFLWEHDIGGEARGCRYCTCELVPGKSWKPLPYRTPAQFAKKPDTCRGCSLFGSGLGYARTAGEGQKGIFLLAESLGEDEERASKPLVGKTGQFTARMVARTKDPLTGENLDLDRDVVRGNILCCKPPFNKIEGHFSAIQHCKQYWQEDVRKAKPKVIYSTGDPGLRLLTGHSGITQLRGSVFETEWGPVVAGLHPAYLLRGKRNLVKYWQLDLLRALYVSRKGAPKRTASYTLYPSGADLAAFYESWERAGFPPLAFDIETPHSSALKDEDPLEGEAEEAADAPAVDNPSYTILRISFSFRAGTAITMPWTEPFISWSKKLLGGPGKKISWNGSRFDVPRLEWNGCSVEGEHVDLMLLFHLLEPGLPMGLKPTANTLIPGLDPAWVSKKLAKDEPVLYSAVDSDVTITVFDILWARAEREGKVPLFQRQFVELDRVLRQMTRKGIRTDPKVRAEARKKFEERFEETVAGVQGLVPIAAVPKKLYKKDEKWLREKGKWVEGRMIPTEVEVEVKPKKLDFLVTYPKMLKKGLVEKTKKVKAFTAEEAMAKVPGAIRADPSGSDLGDAI